jgi:glycosyltransferase involved in cell wall biosynthesis
MKNTDQLNIALDIKFDGANWTGGISYFSNLINALNKLQPTKPVISLVTNTNNNSVMSDIERQGDKVLVANYPTPSPNIGVRLLNKFQQQLGIFKKSPHPLGKFLKSQGIDALFSNSHYGDNFPLPLICWIPDFQHVHYPEMFSKKELSDRDRLFHEITRISDRFLLSSQDALSDLSNFAPDSISKARILSFPAEIPKDVYSIAPDYVCNLYHLPDKFIFLPNQFWKHKNHITALLALDLLRKRNKNITIVCTGNTNDYRNPTYFSELLCQIAQLDLRENFIILGMIPKQHYLQVMRKSLAVLQPSLFEGWSTTIEEAKALGKALIASDIPVHKEQCSNASATFFTSKDPESLAENLTNFWEVAVEGVDWCKEKRAYDDLMIRTQIFGQKFIDVVREIVK